MKAIRRALLFLLVPLIVGGLAAPVAAQEMQEITVEGAIAVDVMDREPVEPGTTFSADVGTLWCWTKVTGAAGQTLEHVWSFGEYEWVVPLDIGGSPWRTYTSKKIVPEWTGDWTVTVRTMDGQVLEELTFTVQ
jgi:hypothetical protein